MDVQTVRKIFLLLVLCSGVRCDDLELKESLKNLNAHSLLEKMSALDLDSACISDLKNYVTSLADKTWAQMSEYVRRNNNIFLGS